MHWLKIKDSDTKVIVEHLLASGFHGRKGKAGYFGGRDLLGAEPGETGTITAYAHEYIRRDAADRAIVIRATLAIGERKESVTFGAMAPQGNFGAANGFESADGAGVVFPRPRNLWQCVWTTFSSDSGPVHSESVSTGGVSSLGSCAGYFLRSVACCACRCRGWCKWLTGCCECR
jgi:hypothetical protein